MRRAPLLCVLACLLSMPACEREARVTADPEPAAAARSESPLGWLEVSMPTSEIRTVDEIEVSITLQRVPGVVAGDLEFDASSAGWTVASVSTSTSTRPTDGGLRSVWNYVLQPFLDGEYEVPSASVELQREGAASVVLTTPAQTVQVSSVLSGDSEPVLAEPRPIVLPSAPADTRPYWFAGAVAAVIAVVVAGVVITRRLQRPRPVPAAPGPALDARTRARAMHDRLSRRVIRLCNAPVAPTSDQLNTHIDRCPWIRDKVGLKGLLARIEEAAYGPALPGEDLLAELDARTTQVLASLDPSTPSEEVA